MDLLAFAKEKFPKLHVWSVKPRAIVRPVADSSAWQGWRMEEQSITPDEFELKELVLGDEFIFDFGEELVGRLRFKLEIPGGESHAPIRLRLLFSETPLEASDDSPHRGLSASWQQMEFYTLENPPLEFETPRFFAMRYCAVRVVGAGNTCRITNLEFRAQSAAASELLTPPTDDAELNALDAAAQRTLRNCMQSSFLDGPKRDRRLWLGDLHLMSKSNGVTFRNVDLLERSIALLAAFPREDGMLHACVYEFPEPHKPAKTFISDYAWLFADLLLEHIKLTGSTQFASQFYDMAERQYHLYEERFHDGVLDEALPVWNFIDWCPALDRTTPSCGVRIFGLTAMETLAHKLGKAADAARFAAAVAVARKACRERLFDAELGVFVSGKKRQISWASQIWMVISGVVIGAEAQSVLEKIETIPDAVRPVTPYLHHHLLEAYRIAGMRNHLFQHIRQYWGAMLKAGMTTFPEVFVPSQPLLTPYGDDPRINSACHAWSCAPAYFIRSCKL